MGVYRGWRPGRDGGSRGAAHPIAGVPQMQRRPPFRARSPPHDRAAGLLYTSAPRAEVTGTAEFVDVRNGLSVEVCFGKLEEARRSVRDGWDRGAAAWLGGPRVGCVCNVSVGTANLVARITTGSTRTRWNTLPALLYWFHCRQSSHILMCGAPFPCLQRHGAGPQRCVEWHTLPLHASCACCGRIATSGLAAHRRPRPRRQQQQRRQWLAGARLRLGRPQQAQQRQRQLDNPEEPEHPQPGAAQQVSAGGVRDRGRARRD